MVMKLSGALHCYCCYRRWCGMPLRVGAEPTNSFPLVACGCSLNLDDPAIVRELQRLQAGGFEEDSGDDADGAAKVGPGAKKAKSKAKPVVEVGSREWRIKVVIWTMVGVFLVWRLYTVLSRGLPGDVDMHNAFDDL